MILLTLPSNLSGIRGLKNTHSILRMRDRVEGQMGVDVSIVSNRFHHCVSQADDQMPEGVQLVACDADNVTAPSRILSMHHSFPLSDRSLSETVSCFYSMFLRTIEAFSSEG